MPKIFPLVDEIYAQYTARVSTSAVNRIVEQAAEMAPPSLFNGRRIKFYYTTQADIRPPTFVSFVNYPEAVHFSYKRFLINKIREVTGLDKTPILFHLRLRKNKIREEAQEKQNLKGPKKSGPKKASAKLTKKSQAFASQTSGLIAINN